MPSGLSPFSAVTVENTVLDRSSRLQPASGGAGAEQPACPADLLTSTAVPYTGNQTV